VAAVVALEAARAAQVLLECKARLVAVAVVAVVPLVLRSAAASGPQWAAEAELRAAASRRATSRLEAAQVAVPWEAQAFQRQLAQTMAGRGERLQLMPS
jgi:hypothetical protein